MNKILIFSISFVLCSVLLLGMIPASDAVSYRGTSFATIEIENIDQNDWKVGQPITVTLTDKDANRDPNVAEKLTLPTAYDFTLETIPNVDPTNTMRKKDSSMPFLSVGSPISLITPSAITLENNALTLSSNSYGGSRVLPITTPDSVISLSSGNSLVLSNAVNVPGITKYASEPKISHFVNYDIRSLNQKLTGGKINSFSIVLENGVNSVTLVESTSNFQNNFKISNTKIAEIKSKFPNVTNLNVKIIFEDVAANAQYSPNSVLPIALDVFSFGVVGQGNQASNYVINAVYRLELEETGANTDTFTGTIAYKRITAKNIQTFDYSKLITSGKNIVFPAFPETYGEKSPRVSYFDRGQDGVITQVADQHALVGRAVIPPIQITTNEDTPITVPLTTDDSFPGVTMKLINQLMIVGGGTISVLGSDNKITFTPEPNYFGTIDDLITLNEWYLPGEYFGSFANIPLQITVNPINDPPSASRMSNGDYISLPNLTVSEDTPFEIKYTNLKTGSYDPNTINLYEPDGDKLTIIIVQQPTNGKITQNTITTYTSNPDFVGKDSMIIKFSDGKLESENLTVNMEVTPVNDIPVSNAGIEQSVNVGDTVQLDGSKSLDVDKDPITYSWIQTAGYPVTLTSNTIVNPKFTAPNTNGQMTFMLTVSDGKATSNPSVINVYVGSTVPVPVPPPSPTLISATASNGAVQLKWSPPAKDGGAAISDYVIEYKQASDNAWKTYYDGKSPNTSSTIPGLKNDASYQFRVSAVNSAGVGEKSSSINAIPKITPDVAKPDVKKPEAPKVDIKKSDDAKKADDKKAADAKALTDKKAAVKKVYDAKKAEKIKLAKERAAAKKAAEAKK